MFLQILQPILHDIHPCSIEEVRHNTQKEKRIVDTLEPVMNQHRLIINRSVIENDAKPRDEDSVDKALGYQLFHQMTHITVDRNCLQNDDRLDSLAGAVEYWNESLAIDEDRAIKDREMELWDLELAAHRGDLEGALDAQVLGIPLEKLGHSSTTGKWNRVTGH